MTLEKPVLLDIFVYGTLKRGQRNHERFCREALAVREATVRGRLYDLPFGFPALVVPEESVLATGTTDYLADVRKQRGEKPAPQGPLAGPAVHGELLTFDYPAQRLPTLDALEGYTPDETGLYERILVPVETTGGTLLLAWTYRTKNPAGVYLPSGRWSAE